MTSKTLHTELLHPIWIIEGVNDYIPARNRWERLRWRIGAWFWRLVYLLGNRN